MVFGTSISFLNTLNSRQLGVPNVSWCCHMLFPIPKFQPVHFVPRNITFSPQRHRESWTGGAPKSDRILQGLPNWNIFGSSFRRIWKFDFFLKMLGKFKEFASIVFPISIKISGHLHWHRSSASLSESMWFFPWQCDYINVVQTFQKWSATRTLKAYHNHTPESHTKKRRASPPVHQQKSSFTHSFCFLWGHFTSMAAKDPRFKEFAFGSDTTRLDSFTRGTKSPGCHGATVHWS